MDTKDEIKNESKEDPMAFHKESGLTQDVEVILNQSFIIF